MGTAKMKYLRLILFFVVVALVCSANSSLKAQEMKKVAQTGFQFLKINPDARAAGMAEAFAAVSDNANATYWNPAAMSELDGFDVALNHVRWFADISQISAAGAGRIGTSNYVGVSVISMDYGEIPRIVRSNAEQGFDQVGTYSPSDMAVGFSYARRFSDRFSVGGTARYARERLGSNTVQAPRASQSSDVDNILGTFAFDLGTHYYVGYGDWRLSLSVRNYSNEVKYQTDGFQLPLTFQVGTAVNVFSLTSEVPDAHRLIVAFDALHPRDYTERLHVGAEYVLLNTVAVRGGYKVNYDQEGMSAGVGLQHTIMGGLEARVDYAYTNMGSFLGDVNRFSVGVSF
jgi:hypothetical protein